MLHPSASSFIALQHPSSVGTRPVEYLIERFSAAGFLGYHHAIKLVFLGVPVSQVPQRQRRSNWASCPISVGTAPANANKKPSAVDSTPNCNQAVFLRTVGRAPASAFLVAIIGGPRHCILQVRVHHKPAVHVYVRTCTCPGNNIMNDASGND